MATSFGALCTDFYVNQKLAMKMDLPNERESIIHLFDRVRKSMPSMDRLHRYEGEYALESTRREAEYRWLAVRRTSLRTGHVNPPSMAEAYRLHKLILEVAPYNLTLSPLDVDYLELMLGFDLECNANHDEVVFEALFADSGVASLMDGPDGKILDVQPAFGMQLSDSGDLQAYFEVKTRPRSRRGSAQKYRQEPISVLLSLRKYGPIKKIEQLQQEFDALASRAESLAAEHLVPTLLTPIAREITSSA